MSEKPMPESDMRVDFPGPFESHDVLVGGRTVPSLTAHPDDAGNVTLILDRRLMLDLTLVEAERVVPFIADAIAVAMGYASFPGSGEPVRLPAFPRMTMIVSELPPHECDEGEADA